MEWITIQCTWCNSNFQVRPGFKVCNCENCYWDMFEAHKDTYRVVQIKNAPFAQYVGILFDIRNGRYYPLRDEKARERKRPFYKKMPSQTLDFSYVGVEEERKKRERLAKEKETLIKAAA